MEVIDKLRVSELDLDGLSVGFGHGMYLLGYAKKPPS
jgi:hypothetical protein